jgi:RILP-like protein 1
MPLISRHRVMAEELDEVSVVEVYEIASQIGTECEKLIDLYGSNCVENLIKKCIVALEMLEAFAEKNERETSLIQELNDRITKLETEKAERAETKRKFEKVKMKIFSFVQLLLCISGPKSGRDI